MKLTEDFEKFIHLIASAISRTHGAEDSTTFADTVVEHAKAIAGEMESDAPKEAVAELPVETPVAVEQNVIPQ